jgi:hypothetical protein
MKSTFSFTFSLSFRPFALPTIEAHIEASEDDEQPAPPAAEQQPD